MLSDEIHQTASEGELWSQRATSFNAASATTIGRRAGGGIGVFCTGGVEFEFEFDESEAVDGSEGVDAARCGGGDIDDVGCLDAHLEPKRARGGCARDDRTCVYDWCVGVWTYGCKSLCTEDLLLCADPSHIAVA